MVPIFLFFSILLPMISPIPYIRSILLGNVKPHRTTRLIILITTGLTTLSLIVQHDQTAIWLSLVSTLQAITLFILSIKFGMGGWTLRDIACLSIAGIGIFAWQTTHVAAMALYFAIFADVIGMVPTILKTYRHPNTELWYFFALDAMAGIFNLLALPVWTLNTAFFPVYIVCINGLVAVLAVQKQSHRTYLIQ